MSWPLRLSSVQSLGHVQLFATPWTAECQASLSITNSRSLLKLMSIESVMPSSHLILCHSLHLLPSTFPSIRVFSNASVLCIRWPKDWSFSFNISWTASTSASTSFIHPMNFQDQFPLELIGLISLQSKGLSRVFSTPKFKSINSSALSFLYGQTLTSIHDSWKNHSFD